MYRVYKMHCYEISKSKGFDDIRSARKYKRMQNEEPLIKYFIMDKNGDQVR